MLPTVEPWEQVLLKQGICEILRIISSDVVTGFRGLFKWPLCPDDMIYLRIENTNDNSKKKNRVLACVVLQSMWCDVSVSRMIKNSVEGQEIRLFWFSRSFDRLPLAPWLDEQVYSVSAPFLPPPIAVINNQWAKLASTST